MYNISESLPLFKDLEPAPVRKPVRRRSTISDTSTPDRHLAAARRLSRVVRKLPDHSEAQTRAGQAICQHLIALLQEASQGCNRE